MNTELDIKKYQEYFAKKHGTSIDDIEIQDIIKTSNGKVKVNYKNNAEIPVERLRRVTGYLSNISNWNDSKQAEEKDRIKHA